MIDKKIELILEGGQKVYQDNYKEEQVVYNGSSESVLAIIKLVENQSGILNCWDFKSPKLLFKGKFYEVGTIFTKDKVIE